MQPHSALTDPVTAHLLARVVHEANRVWVLLNPPTPGNPPTWDAAPDWMRDSAARGVASYLLEGATSPEAQHERWMADKAADGWVYGPVKDGAKKTHPCMLPYDALPAVDRAKDMVFDGVLRVFVQAFNFVTAEEWLKANPCGETGKRCTFEPDDEYDRSTWSCVDCGNNPPEGWLP